VKEHVGIYKSALEQAWKDGSITADEQALLEKLRKTLNITRVQHEELEEDLRKRGVSYEPGEPAEVLHHVQPEKAIPETIEKPAEQPPVLTHGVEPAVQHPKPKRPKRRRKTETIEPVEETEQVEEMSEDLVTWE
jgi:hypothetical protein